MRKRLDVKKKNNEGFTFVEALIGMFLTAVAVLGLAQMFLLCVANNMRADRMTSGTYLAQERIDLLRTLTRTELDGIVAGGNGDENIDVNGDAVNDYRRITTIAIVNTSYQIRVLIFSAEHLATTQASLLANPEQNRVQAQIRTVISR